MKKFTHALFLILSIQLQAMEEGIVHVDREEKAISILANFNSLQDIANVQNTVKKIFDHAKKCEEKGIKVKLIRSINTILQTTDLTDDQIKKIKIGNQTLIDALQSLKFIKPCNVSGKKIVSQYSQYYKSKNQSLEKYLNDLLSGTIKSEKPSFTILSIIKKNKISLEKLSTMKLKLKDNQTVSFLQALTILRAKTAFELFKLNESGELIYDQKKLNERAEFLESRRRSYRIKKTS
jgi:hypothetical protein